MIDADTSRAFVMAALQRMVDDDLAEWDRIGDGKREIRLVSGETLVVGDTGITAKPRRAVLEREAVRRAPE